MEKIPFNFLDTPNGRILHTSISTLGPSFFLDYARGSLGYRLNAQRVLHEPLAKLIPKKAFVFDATGGIAKDAIMMALLGCKVWTCEAHPLIAALVQDGLERVRKRAEFSKLGDEESFRFFAVDALSKIQEFSSMPADERPDIVYLDPMFPPKIKTSSAKKTMQWLQHIHACTAIMYPDFRVASAQELFCASLEIAKKRVIVKRPLHAEALVCSPKASFTKRFESARFDVYLAGS